MYPLIQCVPNFSEARRPEVVEAIVAAIRQAGGRAFQLLNVSADAEHNRTEVTFVGSPASVESAAFAGIAKAAELIDLGRHSGAQGSPRIGATDVVPFIPLRDASMQDCIALARRLGERVGRELNIPVYLYEAAATRPERENLETLRRGQYEGLKAEIATNPAREPDFGPRQLGPAGATIIGARACLLAYNVYFNTPDAAIAKKIAQAVRQSSGGLRFIKAQGQLVEGQAQVSLSLANFAQTPLARVLEFIRREAARYGAAVTRSELVGLVPQAALVDAAQWYLQLDNLDSDQILENSLNLAVPEDAPSMASPEPPRSDINLVDELAAGTAAPGGGAAAAYAGAMAAALVCMVARLTISRKKYATVEAQVQSVLDTAERLRADMLAAVRDDAEAFGAVVAALRQPKDLEEPAARADAIEAAYCGAAEVPLRTARNAVAILGLASVVADKGNIKAMPDAASAAYLARAALSASAINVRANAAAVRDRNTATAWLKELSGLEARAGDALAAIERTLRERK